MTTQPERLIFIDGQLDMDNPVNRRLNNKILRKIAQSTSYNPDGKTHGEFSDAEIVEKFLNYEEVVKKNYNKVVPTNKWFRVLKRVDNQWKFRSGGFIIRNDTDNKYFVFKNREANFTWTFQYQDIKLFKSKGKNIDIFPPKCESFINRYFAGKNPATRNKLFMAFSVRESKGKLFTSNTLSGLFADLPKDKHKPNTIKTIKNVMASGKFRTKGYFFNKSTQDNLTQIQNQFAEIDDCELLSNKAIRKRILQLLRN